MITYEYPLNERIRTLLRLEDLFDKIASFPAQRRSAGAPRRRCVTLFEILDVASRADLKVDLVQELERQRHVAAVVPQQSRDFGRSAVRRAVRDRAGVAPRCSRMAGKIGQYLRENEWLMSIKQPRRHSRRRLRVRPAVLPLLAQSRRRRRVQQRASTAGSRRCCRSATAWPSCCGCCAPAAAPKQQIAARGAFAPDDGRRASAQLVRLRIRAGEPLHPRNQRQQVCAERPLHRRPTAIMRPRQVEVEVPFELTFCNL
ncbi:MAG: cell division protein ZapD [Comamonadaceae bacterium]|nr:cell division protein ZapD [Comamonadaceae bacterium]